MSTVRTFKRGETLFKEGDKSLALYLIQSGSVNLLVSRAKQNRELMTLGPGMIVGEQSANGATTHLNTAVAAVETRAIELPVELVRGQLEGGSQVQKFVLKALLDKLKMIAKDFTSLKMEKDNTPCPEEHVAKIFASVYHSARLKGETNKDGHVTVSWMAVKQYAQRIFLEPPKRFEMTTNIFVKLGQAKYIMGKPDEEPDTQEEIISVQFFDLPMIEHFFEFFQYYYFKGGKQEILKAEDREIAVVQCLLDLAANAPKERNHTVTLTYEAVSEKIKDTLGLQLNNDHWDRLEAKGLFVKRRTADKGVTVQFDLQEFERTFKCWKILREIDRWNEKGHVDPNEPVEGLKKLMPPKVVSVTCSGCNATYEVAPKFCAECGAKFVAVAA